MPRSMTGFGSAEGNLRDGRVRIEIRSVNHRFFNPQLKLTPDLQGVEADLRDRLRELMGRGHVSVSARWTGPSRTATALTVDFDRARAVVAALKELKKRLRLKGEPDLGFVARHPDVLSAQNGDEAPIVWAEVQPVVEAAARDVLAAREREGAALARDLGARLDALDQLAASVAERAPARLAAEADRLRQAVADLTAGGRLDEQRLAMEVALLADRVDVNEELVRFRAHLGACREALAGAGAVGKQLGFLSQELLREANTMGSKANDAPITHAVIAMKGELERFREQLENLE